MIYARARGSLGGMTVSAILIRLREPALLDGLRAHLSAEPRCTPGPDRAGTMAAVLEFETAEEGEALHGWLHTLPGVCVIDVVRSLHDHGPARARPGDPA